MHKYYLFYLSIFLYLYLYLYSYIIYIYTTRKPFLSIEKRGKSKKYTFIEGDILLFFT